MAGLSLSVTEMKTVPFCGNGDSAASWDLKYARPKVGAMLEKLLIARLDGKVGTRKDEEKLVKQWLSSDSKLPH